MLEERRTGDGATPDLPSYADVLSAFFQSVSADSGYFVCSMRTELMLARMLERAPRGSLQLKDYFYLCSSPLSANEPCHLGALLSYASQLARGEPVQPGIALPPADWEMGKHSDLVNLELLHKQVGIYIWLTGRFGSEKFPMREMCNEGASRVAELMKEAIKQTAKVGSPPWAVQGRAARVEENRDAEAEASSQPKKGSRLNPRRRKKLKEKREAKAMAKAKAKSA